LHFKEVFLSSGRKTGMKKSELVQFWLSSVAQDLTGSESLFQRKQKEKIRFYQTCARKFASLDPTSEKSADFFPVR